MSGGAYIEGNTLILGDSSYLEHHGIKGQRWGVRRFQNKDGSLTNAGRKRLGYSTKDVKKAVIKGGKAVGGAAVTIGKAGYKLGKKAVVAAKARSDRKKAEKLEKKKEKASKTRLGVIANSDLFTAKEMEELNKKFKMQDEMTIASLKKGADIVTNIATIARGVNDINSAVENVTGKSLNPFKNASNETKRQKEAAELEQARQNAKKAASQAENEATKAEKAAYEFNKQKDHDKEKAAEKEAKKQQGKSTNDNKSDDDDKPKPPTGDKPKSPDDGGGKGGSADNSPTIPVVPVEYDKNESSGSNKNRTHTLSPEQQKKLVAFMRNKTKGPDDPGDVSDEDVAKYKQAAKDADQRAKSAQDNANNIKTQRDQLDAAIRNYKLPPQQDPNYDAALSQLRAASNRSSELTSAYKKAQSEADTAKANAYRAQREAVASEYGGSKGKNIAKDMAKRMSDASYQHEVDAIDNQRDSNKSAYDRNVAKEYIKDVLNPKKAINRKIDQVASKIADKAVNQQKEALAKERDRSRKQMSSNFEQAMKSGTLDANKAIREYYQREFNLHGAQLDKAVDNYMNAMSKRKTYRRAASHSAINLDSQALVHYGLKGQRWGVRRFQNPDGTRTAAGKARYGKANTEFSGGGGGVPENEDDKVKSIAEALGMDVDDYRKKVDNSPLGYKHAADKLDRDAKKLHEQAEANRRMADQAKSSGYKDKAREFERNAEKCEKQAKSKEGLRDYCQWRADGGTVTKAAANTINQTIDATKNAVGRAFDVTANTVHDLNPGNYSIENKRGRIKIHKKPYVSKFAHGLLVDEDGTLYLEHHGIKGQRWGVRRYRNEDGTLTDKGRKHYQKKLDREKRKQVSSDAIRGTLERQHGFAVGASGIISGIAGALSVAAVVSNPATIAAGAAIAAVVSAGITHGSYSIAEAWEGRGSRIRKKKIAKYEDMLKQDAFFVEDGTLYLEHFGIKNMKWGVRRFQNKDGSLTEAGKKRYGSGEELSSGGGGGGGAPEEDEEMKKKIEEAAKKAGMTVDEYRKKYANVIDNMKKAAKERKEGSQAELAKEAIYGKKEDHLPVLDNKLKLKGPKDAKEAMERYARSAETSRKAADAAYEYEKNNTNSRKDLDKWRNARYLGDSKFHQSIDAEETARRAQAVYNNSKQAKIDEAKRKGARAISDLKRNAKQTAKNVKEDISLAAEDAADAVTGKQSKRLAEGWARNAQKHEKQAQEEKAKYISESRKRGGDNSVKDDHRFEASRHEDEAKKAHDASNYWRQKYDKSLGGRYEKLKATMTERGTAKKKEVSRTVSKVGSKLYDAAGGYHKKEAEEYAKAADDTLRYAQSVDRKGDADLAKAASARRKGNTGAHSSYATYGGNAKLAAKKEYERASALRAGASESKEKYEKSLAGRYDKLKVTMAERGKAKKKEAGEGMGSKLYDTFGGKYKKEAETQRNRANTFNNEAQKYSREYNKQKATQASESRKANKAETSGDFHKHVNNMNVAKVRAKTSYRRKTEAENARLHSTIDANKAQEKYEKSLAGRYDKFKADRERKDRMKRDKMIEDAFRKETPGRTHVLPKMKSGTATAKPMRKLTSKELSKIRSEARVKQLKKDGDYTGEYKKKRRK